MDIKTPIFRSVVHGDVKAVAANIAPADLTARASVGDADGRYYHGLTLLMVAAGSPWSNVEMVKLLIDRGAALHDVSSTGVTAAWYAAAGIPGAVLDESLERDEAGLWTRRKGNDAILSYLLGRGADPKERAGNGRSLLSEACGNADLPTVKVLLDAGADPVGNNPPWDPTASAESPVIKMASKRLLTELEAKHLKEAERRKKITKPVAPELRVHLDDSAIPLHQAARAGSAECVRALLAAGAPADVRDATSKNALPPATTPAVVSLLVAAGADSESSGGFGDVIDKLFEEKNYSAAKDLLKAGAPLEASAWGSTRAHGLAGTHLDLEALKLFVECGGSIFTPSATNGTILHTVCTEGGHTKDSCRLPTATTATTTAATTEMIEYLIAQGVKIDAPDKTGNTALHEAIGGQWPSLEAAKILLDHGANPNVQNHLGETPLMLAASGWVESVTMLLSHGAKPNIQDHKNQTALDYALKKIDAIMNKRPGERVAARLGNLVFQKLFPGAPIDFESLNTNHLNAVSECAHLLKEASLQESR